MQILVQPPDQRVMRPCKGGSVMVNKFNWNDRWGRSVASSLKSFRINCHINNPRDRPPVAGGLQLLIFRPSNRWSD
ncbi:hypothetical protein DEO72_LG4g402 [Vigna unguiculata]|uniref:Uncharacterized protein n=1 Tax=Vigna unguiculata TaxID=3917 RepID=A0A4D6LLW5_VIGUN|nr:hypothetical protein DEO72_LG4g402 [Vigna unguiculata]